METHGGILDGYMPEERFCAEGGISRRTAARYRNEPNGLPYLEFGGKIYIPINAAREFIAKRVRRPNPRRKVA